MDDIVNIFDSNFHLPEKVCIVAPGPNGNGHYHKIPGDYYIIAVSKAVLIKDLSPECWIMTHGDQNWFPEASDRQYVPIPKPEGCSAYGDGFW